MARQTSAWTPRCSSPLQADFSGCVMAAKGPGRHQCPMFSTLSTARLPLLALFPFLQQSIDPFLFSQPADRLMPLFDFFVFLVEGAEWSEARGALVAVG